MPTTPRLGYEYIPVDDLQGYVGVNEGYDVNDALVQPTVKDHTLAIPPGSPAEGDTYIVAASPTGAWTGHATHLSEWIGGAWKFYAPAEGWLCYDQLANQLLYFDGTAWQIFVSGATTVNLNMSGTAPTTGSLPAGYGTFRYTSGGTVTLYVNDSGTIRALVLGAPG